MPIVRIGEMGAKASRVAPEALQTTSDEDERVLVATGRYLGEGFDNAWFDTLFLSMVDRQQFSF